MADELDRTQLVNHWNNSFGKLTVDMLLGAGFAQKFAESYTEKITALHSMQIKLMKPSTENHGLPAKLNATTRETLLKAYQELYNMTNQILNKQKIVQGMSDFDNMLLAFRDDLFDDYLLMGDIVDNQVEDTLSAAVLGSRKKVVTGDVSKGYTMGGMMSSRIATTITDETGNKRTGFFTKEKVVDSPKKRKARLSGPQEMNKVQLNLEDGVRLDNRNSAMSSVAQLLGRGDLIAHSQNMELDDKGKKIKGVFMEFAKGTDLDHCLPSDPYFRFDEAHPYTANAIKDMMDLSIIDYLCLNVDRHSGNMFFNYTSVEENKTRLDHIVGIDNDSSFGARNPAFNSSLNRLASLEKTVVISETMAACIEELSPTTFCDVLRSKGLDSRSVDAAYQRLKILKSMVRDGRDFSKTVNDELDVYEAAQKVGKENDQETSDRIQHAAGFLARPYDYVKEEAPFGRDSKGNRKLGFVILPDSHIRLVQPRVFKANGTEDDRTVGVFANARVEHLRTRKEANRKLAVKYEKNQSTLNSARPKENAVIQIRSQNRREFNEEMNTAFDALLADPKMANITVRGTSKEFENIRTTLKEISTSTKQFSADQYSPSDKDMSLMEEYLRRLNEECSIYLAGKKKLEQQGKTHNYYTKRRIAIVQQIKDAAQEKLNTYHSMEDANTFRMSTKLAAQVNEINAFSNKMEKLNQKQAGIEDLASIATILIQFNEKNKDNTNMTPVVAFYAKKLKEQIMEKGGYEACGMKGQLLEGVKCLTEPQPKVKEADKPEPVQASGPALGH